MHTVVLLSDIHVYATLAGNYRAYVKGESQLQAWGNSMADAVIELSKILARKNIPFDIAGYHKLR